MEHNMKKNIKAIYLTEIALLILTIIFYVLTKVVSSNLKSYLAITFLLMILIPNIIVFGIQNNNSYYSGYISRVVLTVLMGTGIIIYSLGVILGFTHGYHLSFSTFKRSVFPIILITIVSELLRYIVVKYSYGNKKTIIAFTSILAIFHILLEVNYGTLNSAYNIFIFLSTTVFPIIAENFLCTYLIYKGNVKVSILFKLIVELYMYILPIIPNLGDYLYGVMKIMVPYIIFYIIHKNLLQEESQKSFAKASLIIYSVPVIVIALLLVVLVSGIFKYQVLAIATNSMNKVFYRGDAVLLEKIDPKAIEVGDILVFKHGDITVTHRVMNIEEKNNKLYFTTKGDANNSIDAFATEEEDVLGKVNYVIKYIGFPTVWTKELLERGS